MNYFQITSAFLYFNGATTPGYYSSKIFVFLEVILLFFASNWFLFWIDYSSSLFEHALTLALDIGSGLAVGLYYQYMYIQKRTFSEELGLVSIFQFVLLQFLYIASFLLLNKEIEETDFPIGLSFFLLASVAFAVYQSKEKNKRSYFAYVSIEMIVIGILHTFLPLHPTAINALLCDVSLFVVVVASLKWR
jgi:hypothetical protein